MFRLGLTEDIEFRLRWNYDWRFIKDHESLRGSEDLRWSVKLRLTDQEGWLPESAVVTRFSVPTGGKAWSVDRLTSGLDIIYGWEISEGWEIYGSTGYDFNGLGDFGFLPEEPASEHFNVWHQSVAFATELTERVTMYNEWVGLYSTGLEAEFSIGLYNIGVDFYLTDNIVLDVRVGVGLTRDADDFFNGVGGGYRF
ncbi:MAG: transporter [Pirellulales bacterium]